MAHLRFAEVALQTCLMPPRRVPKGPSCLNTFLVSRIRDPSKLGGGGGGHLGSKV